MDLTTLLDNAKSSNKALLAISTVFILGQIFFLNLRWHAYLNVGRESMPFATSIYINLAGYFANLLFITSVGGIIAKSGLSIRYGISIIHSIFATFLDRFMTLFALIILSAISLPFLKGTLDDNLLMMLSISIAFVILSIIIFVACLRLGTFKNFIMSNRKRSRVIATTRTFLENYTLMAKTSVYSLLAQTCFIIAVFILSLSFTEQGVYSFQLLALIPILALISSLPISFGGWGVREGAFIYGLSVIGFSMEDAFLLSIQVGIVTLIAPIIMGLILYLSQKKLLVSSHHNANNEA